MEEADKEVVSEPQSGRFRCSAFAKYQVARNCSPVPTFICISFSGSTSRRQTSVGRRRDHRAERRSVSGGDLAPLLFFSRQKH